MKRALAVVLSTVALVISGCEQKYAERHQSQKQLAPAGSSISYSEVCINGVVYYRLFHMDMTAWSESIAPAFGQDSKVIKCDQKKTTQN